MVDALVRPAGPDDTATLATLQLELWQQAYAGLLPAELLQADLGELELRWRRRLEERGRVLLAFEGPHAVGLAAVGKADPEELETVAAALGEIQLLGVLPRFARRGHGGRLLLAAASALRSFGLTYGIWWTPEADTSVEGFLTAAGWRADPQRRVLDTGEDTFAERRWSGTLELKAR